MKLFRAGLLVLMFCCIGFWADAQFQAAYIGVNGLTCSQCSRTVEMSIRKLDFVADVQMNLEHTEGKIILKKDKKADMEKIAQAVIDAGFSVRYLYADLLIDKSVIASGACINYKGDLYVITNASSVPPAGTVKLTFMGKKYMPKNSLKKMQPATENKCGNVAGKTYYVVKPIKPLMWLLIMQGQKRPLAFVTLGSILQMNLHQVHRASRRRTSGHYITGYHILN